MFLKLSLVVLAASLLSASSAERCENGKDDHCMAQDSPETAFKQDTDWNNAKDIYQFSAKDILGNDVSLDKYRGNVLLIVNVASKCGLTDANYKQLVQLDKSLRGEGLRILAFPSNQFGGQEPGTDAEILDFAKDKYGVEFDMFSKIDVNGDNAHPLWKWLKKQQGGTLGDDIKWNFSKFIVDKEGKAVERFAPTTEPQDMAATLKKYL